MFIHSHIVCVDGLVCMFSLEAEARQQTSYMYYIVAWLVVNEQVCALEILFQSRWNAHVCMDTTS